MAARQIAPTRGRSGSGVKLDRAERRKVMAQAQARQIDAVLVKVVALRAQHD